MMIKREQRKFVFLSVLYIAFQIERVFIVAFGRFLKQTLKLINTLKKNPQKIGTKKIEIILSVVCMSFTAIYYPTKLL